MQSQLVPSPKITELIDDETGRPVSAMELVGEVRNDALRLLYQLHRSRKTGEGQVLCAICSVPVYLCSMPDKGHFYFKHFHENGNCPAITRGGLTIGQIEALKFHGQRESKRHIRLKELMAESIAADPAFSLPVIEGTWKGKEGKDYRRPDVRSRLRDKLDIAFEIQLSTTFGKVMAEREVFYRSEGGLLVWVFGEFTIERARLMMEVVFAVNNRNAFIVNEATRDASINSGALMLECCWAQPSRHKDELIWTQHRKVVRFDELTLDQDRQRAFYVDTDKLEAELLAEIRGPSLSSKFEEFWLAYEAFEGRERPPVALLDLQWSELQLLFQKQGAWLPPRHDSDFRSLMRVLYLARLGKAVGWAYTKLWPAAHHVHDAHKPHLWLFMPALVQYGRLAELEAADSHGKWAWKVNNWRDGVAQDDPAYREERRFDGAVRLAFPELESVMPPEQIPF